MLMAEDYWGHYPGQPVEGKSSKYTYDVFVYQYPSKDSPYYLVYLCISDHEKDTVNAGCVTVHAKTGEIQEQSYD